MITGYGRTLVERNGNYHSCFYAAVLLIAESEERCGGVDHGLLKKRNKEGEEMKYMKGLLKRLSVCIFIIRN